MRIIIIVAVIAALLIGLKMLGGAKVAATVTPSA
jgi:hypothetical protein